MVAYLSVHQLKRPVMTKVFERISVKRCVPVFVFGLVFAGVVAVYNIQYFSALRDPLQWVKNYQANHLSNTVESPSTRKPDAKIPTLHNENERIEAQPTHKGWKAIIAQMKLQPIAPSELPKVSSITMSNNVTCTEKRHIYLLKIEKTGSGSLGVVLARFGKKRNLNYALPLRIRKYQHFPRKKLLPSMIMKVSKNSSVKYDILFRHSIYNKVTVDSVFPSDVVRVLLTREPYTRFISSFDFFDFGQIFGVSKMFTDKTLQIKAVLQKQIKSMTKKPFGNRFFNIASHRLGISFVKTFDLKYIQKVVPSRLKEFSLVMLTEYFAESLVLMKRHLCWKMVDILYQPLHRKKNLTKKTNVFSDELMNMHRKVAPEEYIMYKYVSAKFWTLVLNEGPGFWTEVRAFKTILKIVKAFCWNRSRTKSDFITIDEQVWHEKIVLDAAVCQSTALDLDKFTLRKQREYQKMAHDKKGV